MKAPKPSTPLSSTPLGPENSLPEIPFAVVGVGASAGGVEALAQFLRHLPTDTGMAFVLVQHLDPKHESVLTDILARGTKMPVKEAREGTRVESNCVYVIPPSKDITIANGALALRPRTLTAQGTHLPIDLFFRSLAGAQGTKAIGVILSGNGSDGALGMEEIHNRGGITIAQDPKTAKFDSMPRSAISTECVNFILSPEEIGAELEKICRHPFFGDRSEFVTTNEPTPSEANEGNDIGNIFSLLRTRTGVDFSSYKRNTIDRRILRRMVLKKISTSTEYVAYLKKTPTEVDALYHDILIKVTRFFRDPKIFEILAKKIFGQILRGKAPDVPIRVWVPGCSTGEEVYSLAICLLEFLGDNASHIPIQIFGSDISDKALEKARSATYIENIAADVSPERLLRFFTKANGHYQVNKSVRDLCVFAKQNIMRDPPFSKLDLVSCRNVLIYLNTDLQKKVFSIFHFSLNPKGWLLLGSAESVGSSSNLFTAINLSHRIFEKNANVPPRLNFDLATSTYVDNNPEKRPEMIRRAEIQSERMNIQKEADRALIDRYSPAGVIVNDNLEIVQFRGDTNPYFRNPSGDANLKLLKMAREGLQSHLNAAIKEVKTTNAPYRKSGLLIEFNGQTKKVALEVIPITAPLSAERYWGIMFDDETLAVPGLKKVARPTPKDTSKKDRKAEDSRWKEELISTKTYLESMIEEKEAAYEELQSANEEVLSSNEELQSINEEMQTAREELQSTNEELSTINDELHHSNAQALRLADDLNNILDSVNIPIIMVGIDLKIRRFTPQAEKLLHLIPSDIGRHISDINPRVNIADFEKYLLEAIDNVAIKEQQVQDGHGRWYTLRIHPYKTADKKIDGAVVIFIDVESMKQTEISIAKARDSAEDILATAREAFVVLDSNLRVKKANAAFYRVFHVKPEETEGRHIYDLGGGQWNIPRLKFLLEEIIPKNNSFTDFEVEHDFPEIGRKFMILNATKIFRTQGEERILLAIEDITEIKLAGEAQKKLAAIVSFSDDAIISKDLQGIIRSWNHGAEQLFGYSAEEAIGRSINFIIPQDRGEEERTILRRINNGEHIQHFETVRQRKDGSLVDISLTVSPILDEKNNIIGISKTARDITEHIELAKELAKKVEDSSRSNKALEDFAHTISHDLQSPLNKIISYGDLLKMEVNSALSQKGTEYIDRIQTGAQRMNHLIGSLLEYSQITSSSHMPDSVDMGAVTKESLADLDVQIKEAGARVTVGDLPTVYANRMQMNQLITNLVENAIKYHGDEMPTADISARKEGDFWIFSIRDNGIGIDPKDTKRIFDLFQRVSVVGKTGTGIGLTICKKIVESLGGRIWVESEPGKGSTFHFTLPVK